MKSGGLANLFPAAGFEPVGWGQSFGVFGLHGGQVGKNFREVFLGVDAEATAVFHDGVEDGAFLTGFFVAEEQPVFRSKFGRAYRVFDEIVADFHPAVAKIGFEVGPLVDGVADGFAEFAFGPAQDGMSWPRKSDHLVAKLSYGGGVRRIDGRSWFLSQGYFSSREKGGGCGQADISLPGFGAGSPKSWPGSMDALCHAAFGVAGFAP